MFLNEVKHNLHCEDELGTRMFTLRIFKEVNILIFAEEHKAQLTWR